MAEYKLERGKVGVYSKTLVAATVDTVKSEGYLPALEIVSNGAEKIFVTIDGSAPTVGGENTYEIPKAACVRVIPNSGDRSIDETVVKLISAGTPEYSIARNTSGKLHLVAV